MIITEPSDNLGVSVTNAVEYIAEAIMDLLPLKGRAPDEIVWVEHYPQRERSLRIEETWDQVKFLWEKTDNGWHASEPEWHPLNKEAILRLLTDQES